MAWSSARLLSVAFGFVALACTPAWLSDAKVIVSGPDVTWYSGSLAKDEIWLLGMIDATSIW